VHEVARVLDGRGRFVLTNIDPWEMRGWVLYRFFPAAWDLDQIDFLPADSLVSLMRAASFRDVRVERDHRRTRESLSDFLGYARRRHRTSQLLAISDAEYDVGVRRLERALAEAPSADTTFESEFCLLTVSGDKP
jgi:hypothetical protein